VPRGARGLTADGVFPNIPRFKLGCSSHSDKSSALRRMTHRGGSAIHALAWDKSTRAHASGFSKRVIELRIVLRFVLGVVTAPILAMTSHMSPRRHHLLPRKRPSAEQVLPTHCGVSLSEPSRPDLIRAPKRRRSRLTGHVTSWMRGSSPRMTQRGRRLRFP